MSQVADYGAEVRALADAVGPSVAGLGRGWGHGSGVVVADGLVLTVAHVLRGPDVAVTFRPATAAAGGGAAGGDAADGGGAAHGCGAAGGGAATERRIAEGRVVGLDAELDLAVVAVDTGGAPAVEWDPERVAGARIGTPVVALADPGGRGLRATLGLVAAADRSFRGARGRRVAGAIEHTAPLPRGSAGGPLLDADGHLLGLNAVRLEGGLLLALPADAELRAAVEELAAGRAAAARPQLGVALASPQAGQRLRAQAGLAPRDGLLVRAVKPGSPADRAGIDAGDLLVTAAGEPLLLVDDLLDALQGAPDAVEIRLVRGDREGTATAHFSK